VKIAAIDIGSNAIRFQVTSILEDDEKVHFKKLEYVRFPLRLGNDVFTQKSILPVTQEKFVKLMRAFKLLLELYEVQSYRACATSAMREARNGKELAKRVKDEVGIAIDIIDGNEEAELINSSLAAHIESGPCLHIDVGGGSTELNLYVNREKIAQNSFKIGSVRRISHHQSPMVWKKMEEWITTHVKKEFGRVTAIGTGGNINKIADLAKKKPGKKLSIQKIEEVRRYLSSFTLHERIHKLQLNPDRADVILPASEIYTFAMRKAKATSIIVPDLGLKDGIILGLYTTYKDEFTGGTKHS
jgi:exopolyphosphatase/guanosine-5'-triphosphate,3'-diphosphate pyrophosphatase